MMYWTHAFSCLKLLSTIQTTTTYALVYFHKYDQKTRKQRWDVGTELNEITMSCSAILMACKATENLRSLRDIFNVVYTATNKNALLASLDQVCGDR